jgi:hypothetical protein
VRILLEEVVLLRPSVADANAISDFHRIERSLKELKLGRFVPGPRQLVGEEDTKLHSLPRLKEFNVSGSAAIAPVAPHAICALGFRSCRVEVLPDLAFLLPRASDDWLNQSDHPPTILDSAHTLCQV